MRFSLNFNDSNNYYSYQYYAEELPLFEKAEEESKYFIYIVISVIAVGLCKVYCIFLHKMKVS